MEPDFSGYATKAGLKCSDGRTIMPDAFKHQDKMTVPLVWQHGHNNPENILGHAVLEHRKDGVYAHGFFNDTKHGQQAKALVVHEDIKALSIYANKLVEKAKNVIHGAIKEVSLVLSGANPGALIDFVAVKHSDGEIEELEDEAIIYTGLELQHSGSPDDVDADLEHDDGPTVEDVYNSLTDEQKDVVHFMIGAALEAADSGAQHSDEDDKDGDLTHKDKDGNDMGNRNVFDRSEEDKESNKYRSATLSHSQLEEVLKDAKAMGSFKDSLLAHAGEYGIENIDYLFPDPKTLGNSPELVSRRQEWVSQFWDGLRKNPFSRIKTLSADITFEDARAKGYIKGSFKKEEFFALAKRTTTPTTIYKKQKLDRDDIVDITDLDVVAWLKAEMRLMLNEELARAALVGDGRAYDDEDKIKDGTVDGQGIRPIAFEDDFYAHKITVDNMVTGEAFVEAVIKARKYYRGAGNPTMYTTEDMLSEMLLARDGNDRRYYNNVGDLQVALRVSDVQTVPVMENQTTQTGTLVAVLVNPNDYTIGADSGGPVSMFDDFDIDYNQYKYLIETRCSGALTKFKTALVFSRSDQVGPDAPVTPAAPTFVPGTGVTTIVATSGVVYKNAVTGATLATGAQTALASGDTLDVIATPTAGHVIEHDADAEWTFTRP